MTPPPHRFKEYHHSDDEFNDLNEVIGKHEKEINKLKLFISHTPQQSEREKVLDEIFPKHTKTLEDGWIYNSVLRHKLEHAIAERNEWDLGEEEIEEVLMVFEEELRQEGKQEEQG